MICPYCDGDGEFIDLGYSSFSEYPIDIRAECPMCEGRKKVDPSDVFAHLGYESCETRFGSFYALRYGFRMSGPHDSLEDAAVAAFELDRSFETFQSLLEAVRD